jgi:hypothetical protein
MEVVSMWSPNWKNLLLIAPASALFLTACPDNHKKNNASESYSYAGIWVNANLYGAYRELNKADHAQFCHVITSDPARFGIEQEPYGDQLMVVDSWVINNRGEVLVYNPRYNAQDTGYRETYWKGSVDQYGYFKRRTGAGFQSADYGRFQNSPYYFYYASDARLFLNNATSMRVWAGNSSREYIRTEDRPGNQEMANLYMAAINCFASGANDKLGPSDMGMDPQGVRGPRRVRRRRDAAPGPACPGGPSCAKLPNGSPMGQPPPPIEEEEFPLTEEKPK